MARLFYLIVADISRRVADGRSLAHLRHWLGDRENSRGRAAIERIVGPTTRREDTWNSIESRERRWIRERAREIVFTCRGVGERVTRSGRDRHASHHVSSRRFAPHRTCARRTPDYWRNVGSVGISGDAVTTRRGKGNGSGELRVLRLINDSELYITLAYLEYTWNERKRLEWEREYCVFFLPLYRSNWKHQLVRSIAFINSTISVIENIIERINMI